MDERRALNIGCLVKEGYNKNQYNEKYRIGRIITEFEKQCIDIFLSKIKSTPRVLDLGCGAALIYDQYMEKKGCQIVGVDFSEKQIEGAKKNCNGTFYCENMLDFPITREYDGITLFYSLFHVNREYHKNFLSKIYKNTSDDCCILLNAREKDEGIKQKIDFCNYPMYWSHYSYNVFVEMISAIGFKITILGNEKDYGSSESHVWMVLSK